MVTSTQFRTRLHAERMLAPHVHHYMYESPSLVMSCMIPATYANMIHSEEQIQQSDYAHPIEGTGGSHKLNAS